MTLDIRAWLRAQWYRLFRDPEPYDKDFAGEVLDCGCDPGALVYTCMKCEWTRCSKHRNDPHACVDSAEQTAKALLTPDCPSIVAGSDIDASQWAGIVQRLPDLAEIDAKALEAFYLITNPAIAEEA